MTDLKNYHKELGKIRSTFFGIEDHGMLTIMIDFDFGGSGQGFGGYALDISDGNKRVGTAAGTDFLLRILKLFKVDQLKQIVGRTAYALKKGDRFSSSIVGIQLPKFDGAGYFLVADWIKDFSL